LLDELTKAAEQPDKNLLEIAVRAAQAKATVGEISDALRNVWGEFKPTEEIV